MNKLISVSLLAAAVLVAMPAWGDKGRHDRHDSKHHTKHYAKHHDKHDSKHRHKKRWKRHWKKYHSHGNLYRPGHRHFKRHHYHGRYYSPFLFGYSPYGYNNGNRWGIVFRYFD